MAHRQRFCAHKFSLRPWLAKARLAVRRWLRPWRALAGREALSHLRRPRWVKLSLEPLEDIAAPTNLGLQGWLGQAALAPLNLANMSLLRAASDAAIPASEESGKTAETGTPDRQEQWLSDLVFFQTAAPSNAAGHDYHRATHSTFEAFALDSSAEQQAANTDESDLLSPVAKGLLDPSVSSSLQPAKQG